MAEEIGALTYYLNLEINDEQLNDPSFQKQFEQKGREAAAMFKSGMAEYANSDGPLGEALGFMSTYMERQSKAFNTALKSYTSSMKKLNGADNTYSPLALQTIRSEAKASASIMREIMRDTFDTDGTKTLATNFAKQLGQLTQTQLGATIKQWMPELSTAITRQTMQDTRTLFSGKAITDIISSTNSYNKMVADIQRVGNIQHELANAIAQNMVRLAADVSAPDYTRGDKMRLKAPESAHMFTSFQSMVPKSATKALDNLLAYEQGGMNPYHKFSAYKTLQDVNLVSKINELQARLQKDAYLNSALERVGLVTTSNGTSKLSSNISGKTLAAAAGLLLNDTISAAKGMKMYGIETMQDLLSDKFRDRVVRKGNQELIGNRDALSWLVDNFMKGSSLKANPIQLYDDKTISQIRSNMLANNKYGFAYNTPFADRRRRFEVASYSLAEALDLDKGGRNWQKGGEIDATKRNGEKYHHEMLDESTYLRTILKYSGQENLKNNDILDKFAIVKFPEDYREKTEEEQKKIFSDASSVFRNGIKRNGRTLQFVGANKSGVAYFADSDVVKNIQADLGAGYFWGGVDPKTAVDYKTFASIQDHTSKGWTGSYSLKSAFGSDLSQISGNNIILFDGKKLTGLDGGSFLSSKFVPQGFQARGNDLKNTLTPGNFAAWAKFFGMESGGIPIPSIDGVKRYLNGNTTMLLSTADIKDFDKRFRRADGSLNDSYQNIANTIATEMRDSLSIARTTEDAEKTLKFITGQAAGMLSMTDDDVEMFTKEYRHIFDQLNTAAGARRFVFGPNSEEGKALEAQPGLVKTKAFRDRINEFRDSIVKEQQKGSLPIPSEITAVSRMALPYNVDMIKTILDQQKDVALSQEVQNRIKPFLLGGANEKVYAPGLGDQLDLNRLPSALGSWVVAANLAKTIGTSDHTVRAMFESMGFDPNAVYFKPGSNLLQYMQGADFDGDMISLYGALAGDIAQTSKDKTRQQALTQFHNMVARTNDTHNNLFRKAYEYASASNILNKSEQNQKTIAGMREALSSANKRRNSRIIENLPESLRNQFSLENSQEALVERMVLAQAAAEGMGAPHWVGINAFNLGSMTPEVAFALTEALTHYDVNSTSPKTAEQYESSNSERALLYRKNFTRLYKDFENAKDERGNLIDSKILDRFANKNAEGRSLYKIAPLNPEVGNAYLVSQMARVMASSVYGMDNGARDFTNALNVLTKNADSASVYNISGNTAVGQYRRGLLEMLRGHASGEFVLPSEKDIATLMAMRNRAAEELRGNRSMQEALNEIDKQHGSVVSDFYSIYNSMTPEQRNDLNRRSDILYATTGRDRFYSAIDFANPIVGNYAKGNVAADANATRAARVIDQYGARFSPTMRENIINVGEQARLGWLNGTVAKRIDENGKEIEEQLNKPMLWSYSMLTKMAHPEYQGNDVDSWLKYFVLGDKSDTISNKYSTAGHIVESAVSRAFAERAAGKTAKEIEDAALSVLNEGYIKEFGSASATGFETYDKNVAFIKEMLPQINKDMDYLGSQVAVRINLGDKIKKENTSGAIDDLFYKDGKLYISDTKNTVAGVPDETDKRVYGAQAALYAGAEIQLTKRMAEVLSSPQHGKPMLAVNKDGTFTWTNGQTMSIGDYFTPANVGLEIGGMHTIHAAPTSQDIGQFVVEYFRNANGGLDLGAIRGVQTNMGNLATTIYNTLANPNLKSSDFDLLPIAVREALGLISPEHASIAKQEIEQRATQYTGRGLSGSDITNAIQADRYLQEADRAISNANNIYYSSKKSDGIRDRYSEALMNLEFSSGNIMRTTDYNDLDTITAKLDEIGTARNNVYKGAINSATSGITDIEQELQKLQNGTIEIKGLDKLGDQFSSVSNKIADVTNAYNSLQKALKNSDGTSRIQSLMDERNSLQSINAKLSDNDPTKKQNEARIHQLNSEIGSLKAIDELYKASGLSDEKIAEMQKNGESIRALKLDEYIKSVSKMFEEESGGIGGKQKLSVDERINQYKQRITSYSSTVADLASKQSDTAIKNRLLDFSKSLQIRSDQITKPGNLELLRNQLIEEDKLASLSAVSGILNQFGVNTYNGELARMSTKQALTKAQDAIMAGRLQYAGTGKTVSGQVLRRLRATSEQNGTSLYDELSGYVGQNGNTIDLSGFDEYELAALKLTPQQREAYKSRQNTYRQQLFDLNLKSQYGNFRRNLANRVAVQPRVSGALAQSLYRSFVMPQYFKQDIETYTDAIAKNQIQQSAILEKYGGDTTKLEGTDKINFEELVKQGEQYKQMLNDVTAASASFSKGSSLVSATVTGIANSFQNLISRFGYRAFMTAINNVKNFVKQYDASLTNIRMITLKSDEEMAEVSQNNITMARNLNTNALAVSQVQEGLFRQGLSDEQVQERTEAIIKLSRVTGINTGTASKMITTALQNGLVEDAEEAIDVLAALGDSAATTADEIQKALQKTAASAANAGISYQELTAILTAAISKTQLSGNVVGTAFSTIMTRMRKISEAGYVKASNGDITSANDVSSALSRVGVKVFEGNQMRNLVDILQDLASVWNTIDSDILKQNIVYAMAGRGANATNTFYSIMDAFGEDGEFARLLGIASGADGTVNAKYDQYINSFTGSLEAMRGAFQEWTTMITDSGVPQFFTEMATSFMRGQAAADGWVSAIGVAVAVFVAALTKAALAAKASGLQAAAGGVMTLGASALSTFAPAIALIAGIALPTIISLIGNAKQARAEEAAYREALPEVQQQQAMSLRNRTYGTQAQTLEVMQTQLEKYVETYKTFDELMANTDDFAEYQKALTNLGGTFSGDFVNDVRSACEQMDDFAKALKLVKEQMNQVTSEKTMNQIALDFAQRDDKTAYATTSTMINTLFGKGDYNKIAMTDLKDVNDIPLAMVLNDVIKRWYNSDAASITSITPRNSSNGDVYEITFNTGETIGSKQQEYTVYGNKFLSATGRRNGVFSSDLNELWYVISEMAAEANTAYPEGGGFGDTDKDNVQVYLAAAKDVLEKYGVFVKTQNGETSFTDINGEPIAGETVAKKYYQQLFAGERDVTSFLSTLEGVDQDKVFEEFYDFYLKQLAEDSNVTFYKAMSRYFNPENKNGFASNHNINAIVDKTNQPKDYYFVNPMLNNQNVYDENGNFIEGAVLFGVEGVTSIESQTFNENIQKLARNANTTSQQIKAKQDFISASNKYDEAQAVLRESQDYFNQLMVIDADYAQYLADYTQHLASEPIYENFYFKALEQAEATREYKDIMRNAEQTVSYMAKQAANMEGDIISGLTGEVATAMVADVPQWYIDALAATDVIDVGRVEKTLSEEANQAISAIEHFSRDYGAEFSQAETVYNNFIGQVAGVLEEQYMSQMDDIVQMFHSQLTAGSIRDDQIVGYESKIASAESDIANIKTDLDSYSAALKRQEEIVAYQDELATLNASIADFEANTITADVETYKQALANAVDQPELIDAEAKRQAALDDIATQFQQDVGLTDTLSSLLGPSVEFIEAAKATVAEKKNISEQNYAAYTSAQDEYKNIMSTIGELKQEKADAEQRKAEAKAQLTKLSPELVDKDYQLAVEYVNEMYKETDDVVNDWFKDYTTISKERYDTLVKEQNEAVEGWKDSKYASDLADIMAKYGNQIGGNKAKKEMEDAMARAKKRSEERATLIYKYQETQKYFDESDRELYYDIANAKKVAKEAGAEHWLPYVSEKSLTRIDQIRAEDESGRSVLSLVNKYLPNLAALSSTEQDIATEDALIAELEKQIDMQYAAANALGVDTLRNQYLDSTAIYKMWNDAYNKATSSIADVEQQYKTDLATNAALEASYNKRVAEVVGEDYTDTVIANMLASGNEGYLQYESNKTRVQTVNEEMAKLFELNQPFEELFAQGNYEDVVKTRLADAEQYLSSLITQRDTYIDTEAQKLATEYLNKYYLKDLVNNATELIKGLTSEAEADKLGLDGLWDAISTYRELEEELANDPNLASDEYRGQKISDANEVLMNYVVELATQMWETSPEYQTVLEEAKADINQRIQSGDPVGELLNLAIEYGIATVDDYKAKAAQVTEIRGQLAQVFTTASKDQANMVSGIQDDLFDVAFGAWSDEGKDLGKTYSDINRRMIELTGVELANISEEKTLATSRLVVATANKDKNGKMLEDQARRAGITLGSGNEAEEAMAALVEMATNNAFGYSGGDVYEYIDYLNSLEGQLTEVLQNGRWFDYVFDKTGNVMWQKLGFATSDDTNRRKAMLLNMANNAANIGNFSSAYEALGWDADTLNRVFGSAENVTAFNTSLTNGTIDTVREALFKNLYGVSSSEYAQNIRKNVDESRNALREWNAFVETGYNVNSEQFANVQELLTKSGVNIQGDWADALPETFELANKAIQTNLQNAYYTNTIIPLMNDISTQIGASEDLAKYIKENPTATIYDFLGSHQNNKQLNQLVEYANSLGVGMGWMVGEDNNVVVRPTHWSLSANAYEDVINVERYTPTDIYDLAQEYAGNIKNGRLALRSFTTRLSKSQQEALAQQYGGMIEYAMLSESEKDTEYGRNLEREYKIQFATFGLDELEKAGKILDGITQNTQTLMSANYSKAFSGMAQMSQTFAESNRAVNAYYRAVNDHEMLTQEEWNLIGKTFGISDMTPYQTGQFSLETLSGAVEAQQSIAEESALKTYESLIKWEDENAPDIEVQDLTAAQKIVGKIFPKLLPTTKKGEADRTRSNQYRDLMKQFGFDYVNGEFKYNPELDKTANMTAEQILKNRAAIKSFTSDANLGEDEYNELFKLSKQTDFLAAIEQSGNKRLKTLFTQMATGGNLDKFINEDGTLNMAAFQQYMYRQQYGISSQEYKYGNENVSGFIDSLLGGSIDYNKYKNMEDFSDIEAAVKRYVGSENYDELLRAATQEEITASDTVIKAARRTLDEQQVIDLMQNRLYSQQIQSLYGSYSGTETQYNQTLRSYQQQAQTYGNALWAVGELANGGLYDNAVMQTVMNATGLSEKQIFDLMDQTDGQKKIEEIVKESIQETQNGIEEYFAAALDIDVASISGLDTAGIRAKFEEAGKTLDEFGEFLLTILGYINTPDTKGEFPGFDEYVQKQYNKGRYTNVGYLRDIINAEGHFSAEKIEAKDREQFVSEYAPLAYAMANKATPEQILSMARTAMYGGNDVESDLSMLQSILGEGWAEEKNVEQRFTEARTNPELAPYMEYMLEKYPELQNIMQSFGSTALNTSDALDEFFDSMRESLYMKEFGEDGKQASEFVKAMGKNARTATQAIGSMTNSMHKLGYQNKILQEAKGKSGAQLGSEELDMVSAMLYTDKDIVKKMDTNELAQRLQTAEQAVEETWSAEVAQPLLSYYNEWASSLSEEAQQSLAVDLSNVAVTADGQLDLSAVAAILANYNTEIAQLFMDYAGTGGTLYAEITEGENAISYLLKFLGAGAGKTGTKTGGGGGGGGKSKIQEWLDNFTKKIAVTEHQIKMIQFQETKYQNRGELSNYGAMVELETQAQREYITKLENGIESMKKKMKSVKKHSDDWYALRDAIMKYEEEIESANNAIEDNNRKLKENQQAIYKTRTDLEDMVRSEADTREKTRRDILSATVSMEDTILEAIRKRYQDEWDLIKRDIDRKRNALEEEKNLINERLQARKDAEQEAEKYEQLAEYQRQLAYVVMDPTRTKDALELQHKIDELQKELAWTTAEREAQAQQEAIDDQIQAYEQFMEIGDEDLAAYLEDATNFTSAITELLEGTHEDLIAWLKANVDDYKLALDEQQQNMVENWTDTWKAMMHITETWAELILETLSGRESFIEYMKQSDEYLLASDDMRLQLMYKWNEMWDDYINARITGATYSHTDDWTSYGTSGSSSSGSGSGGNNAAAQPVQTKHGYSYVIQGYTFAKDGFATKDEAVNAAIHEMANIDFATLFDDPSLKYAGAALRAEGYRTLKAYKEGGLADYTGLAWVDGTKTRPEGFLNADDTKLMRGFLDAAKYVSVCATMTSMPDEMFSGDGSQTIESVNITINEATISDDMDIQELAEKIGDSFIKELSINGMNASKYSY